MWLLVSVPWFPRESGVTYIVKIRNINSFSCFGNFAHDAVAKGQLQLKVVTRIACVRRCVILANKQNVKVKVTKVKVTNAKVTQVKVT